MKTKPTAKPRAIGRKTDHVRLIAKPPILLEQIQTHFEGELNREHLVTVERKAWQCVLCKKWQEFTCITLNGQEHVAKGCGGSSHFYEGHQIDHCSSMICLHGADITLGLTQQPSRKK